MEKKEMVCIRCPLGCMLTAVRQENGEVAVTGNTCPRGAEYAVNEMTDPRRTVTTTVRIKGKKDAVVSVKTAGDIPKDKIMECIEELRPIELEAPVHIGDVALANTAGTGVDVVVTRNYNG